MFAGLSGTLPKIDGLKIHAFCGGDGMALLAMRDNSYTYSILGVVAPVLAQHCTMLETSTWRHCTLKFNRKSPLPTTEERIWFGSVSVINRW
jgi:hypothetical protein